MLDAGVLGQASHPRRNQAFAQWFTAILATDTTVFVSEIADYEIRRELIRADRPVGLARLNALKTTLPYLPLTTRIVKKSEHIALQEVTNPPCLTPRLDFHHSMAHTPHQYGKSQRR